MLHDVTTGELDTLLDDAPNDLIRLLSVFRAGHIDYCEDSAKRAGALVAGILDADVFLSSDRRTTSPIEALSHILFDGYVFRAGANGLQLREARPDEPDVLAKVRTFVAHGEDEPRFRHDWSRNLDGWNEQVERGRALFGERWAWCRAANSAAAMSGEHVSADAARDPFDESVPLCLRARYARLRAGAATWWIRQLEVPASSREVAFVVLLCATWAGPKAMVQAASALDKAVRGLRAEEYASVYGAMTLIGPFGQSSVKHMSLDVGQLPDIHPRTAALMAVRLKSESRNALHDRFLKSYKGRESSLLMAIAAWESQRTLLGDGDWDQALRLLRRAYAQLGRVPGLERYGRRTRGWTVSPVVANEIVRSAASYPASLVQLAENSLRDQATAHLVPMQEVAELGQWFT